MTEADLFRALVAEAAKKSDLVWVEVPGRPARALWHVWHDDAVLVVTGELEQPDPGLSAGKVRLMLRSKDKGGRVATVEADAERVDPGAPDYDALAAALFAKRLNSPDGDAALERWRRDCAVWRITPHGQAIEGPGSMSDVDHRAVPMDTEATTHARRPFHLGKATHRRK